VAGRSEHRRLIEFRPSIATARGSAHGFAGRILESSGDTVDGGSGGSGIAGGFVEQVRFDGPGAAGTPLGGGHFLDQAELEAVDGLEPLDVMSEDGLKRLGGFIGANRQSRQNCGCFIPALTVHQAQTEAGSLTLVVSPSAR